MDFLFIDHLVCFKKIHVCMHMNVYITCHDMHIYVWKSEDNLKNSFLLSYVGSGYQTQLMRFGGKRLYH